jgi:5-methyltetrahydropteroyltriglutamate--homocysteine methyltransferase
MTAASPGVISLFLENRHYPSHEAYIAALAEAMKEEYDAIHQAGFVLQLDCPDLAVGRHVQGADESLSDWKQKIGLHIEAINAATREIPPEDLRLHLCWGNYEGPHDFDVELKEIMPVLRQANVGGFVVPVANPRHAHEYRVLRDFPLDDDQIIVAGVIDSVTNFVEHPETIADRIERVAEVVGDPKKVQAGTDCGFDTSAGMRRVAEDVVWAKLAALSEGAKIASERLF